MGTNRKTGLVLFGLRFCFLAGLAVGVSFEGMGAVNNHAAEFVRPAAAQETGESNLVQPRQPVAGPGGWSFSDIAHAVAPAVINVSSTRIVQERVQTSPFGSDPFFDFFGRRFFSVPRERRERSLGSGVIVTADGYVLTNNHVVENATEVLAYLPDGRQFNARIVGADPETDVAVLKLDSVNFPTIPFGDSDAANIGDVVLALGNPFGLGQTVTMGIISAKGRANVGMVEYEDFIQTDAAINPGNSGGALVDISGRLIGINTAIFSRSGGYQGIGFAIPANMAQTVMNSIIDQGRFVRGWAGITYQDLDPDIAPAFNAEGLRGALVNDVMDKGPGTKAGLQRGDIITALDGQEVTNAARLKYLIALAPSGKSVDLEYYRRGQKRQTSLTIEETPSEYIYLSDSSDEWVSQIEGVVVENITGHQAEQLGLRKGTAGVLVKDILARSPAAYSGLRAGDVILEIDNTPIENVEHFKSVASKAEGKKMILLIVRRGSLYYLSF
jgi:serine protease Do